MVMIETHFDVYVDETLWVEEMVLWSVVYGEGGAAIRRPNGLEREKRKNSCVILVKFEEGCWMDEDELVLGQEM